MTYYKKKDYQFIKFEKSKRKNKKYAAILRKKNSDKIVKVHFGAKGYQQYEDKALGLYKHLNHYDKIRRRNYRRRHTHDINKPYSASWFSLAYLW